jgi:hydroxymethylglutaryl-CoA reductase
MAMSPSASTGGTQPETDSGRCEPTTSRIPGFYRLPPDERLDALAATGALDLAVFRSGGLTLPIANAMVENVIATFALPCAAAVNFVINGRERIVPMVVEEPSVVAAVSNMARLARRTGGFAAESDPGVMIGQVQLMDVDDPDAAIAALEPELPRLERIAGAVHPRLVERGGGVRGLELRRLTYDEPGRPREEMVVLHLFLDCVDAMGANMVNTVAEHLAPHVEAITGGTVGLRILSNLADRRLSRASVRLAPECLATGEMDGAEVARRIAAAWRFAWADPYRAATHNKGVMNGVDAVALATGNDWRAIEAGVHAWCSRDGQYRPLTRWEVDADGMLCGSIELPLQMGTVGGPIRLHPTVRANLNLLGSTTSADLSAVTAAVGLAQNMGALRALATEGIQAGHMRMHARIVAATAGAEGAEIPRVVATLVEESEFSVERAAALVAELRAARS